MIIDSTANIPNYSGVYSITHTVSDKRYIGSSVNIGKRWKQHIRHLRSGKHASILLQRAWDKYGEDSFLFTVLEKVDNVNSLANTEQNWIDVYESYESNKGYNVSPTVYSQRGVRRTLLTRNRISESLKAYWRTKEYSRKKLDPTSNQFKSRSDSHSKNWIVIDPEGVVYNIRNLSLFCKSHGLNQSHMGKVARGEISQYKGWTCKYN